MKHIIEIDVINDAVGIPQSADGIMGIFAKAIAVGSTFALDTPYLLTKLADLATLGINAAYDLTNGLAVYQQVSEYYGTAGDGALLWLFGVNTATAYATYVAGSTFDTLVRFTAQADPLNQVKMIGLCYEVPNAGQTSADFPVDVTNTITALQIKQQLLFNQGYQFSAIIDGYKMSSTVTPSTLGTMATKAAFSVSMCITGNLPNGVSAIGMALGRFARISVGHGFGAVEDGPIAATNPYLTNAVTVQPTGNLVVGKVYTVYGGDITYNSATVTKGSTFTAVTGQLTYTTAANGYVVTNATTVASLAPSDIDALGTKQFLFMRYWQKKSGFYWNDGATCTDPTLQLSTQEYNRVANKMSSDALSFFINEMGKNLPLNRATGNVDQGYLNAKQQQFYTQYINPLTVASGTGDITDGSIILTGPNFNSTKTINFTLNIEPTPILGNVAGVIQFVSTL
jgi:hypothetical protein